MTVTMGSARKEQQHSNQLQNDNQSHDNKHDKHVVLGSSRKTHHQSSQSSQYRNPNPTGLYTSINNMP